MLLQTLSCEGELYVTLQELEKYTHEDKVQNCNFDVVGEGTGSLLRFGEGH